jgi:S-adenosylmethionine synthetase
MSQPVDSLIISPLQCVSEPVEVVERKGLGHPDTICDALAESLSRALSREYRDRFGAILHHNVDKALLCAGRAAPAFGGGAVLEPMSLVLAGRATSNVAGERLPIKEIAVESARGWLKTNLRALDPDRHVRIEERIQPGSVDLQALFSDHAGGDVARANDTSIGVGYAPLSPLERLVLALEKHMNAADRATRHPAWGEDVKIMGVRNGNRVDLTVACAMIGRHIPDMDDYLAQKAAVANMARDLAAGHGFDECDVGVNHADNPGAGSIYLTVTGTSAEAGDDGQVGRGNRINGLITPTRPMSLEAAAGKNPVSHVGKIYNVVARGIAAALLALSQEIARAECLLVSRIGAPVTQPAIVHIRLATLDGGSVDRFKECASEIAADHLRRIPRLVDEFMAGTVDLF